jgi:NAD(P)-dependent dehydrogenase (short-subunit alcohol dehydrogenase family)
LGRRCVPIVAHAGKKESIDDLVNKTMNEFKRIDILVNNAGASPYFGETVNAEEWAWDVTMNLNLKGYFLLSQVVAKIMIKQGGGCILNVASVTGIRPYPGSGIYCISKAGVIMLTQVLAIELGQYHIRVNAIAPGVTRTRGSQAYWDNLEIYKMVTDHTALGRIAESQDMVGIAVFLVSDASEYMTGQTISVDGGSLALPKWTQ